MGGCEWKKMCNFLRRCDSKWEMQTTERFWAGPHRVLAGLAQGPAAAEFYFLLLLPHSRDNVGLKLLNLFPHPTHQSQWEGQLVTPAPEDTPAQTQLCMLCEAPALGPFCSSQGPGLVTCPTADSCPPSAGAKLIYSSCLWLVWQWIILFIYQSLELFYISLHSLWRIKFYKPRNSIKT